MPNVLCIAYLFPPRAGVGVQRITKFVRYLPEFGWSPIVLTPTKPEGSFPVDEGYQKEIPESVKIYTAPSYEPYHIYRALGGSRRQDSADFRSLIEGGKRLGMAGRLYSAFQAAFLIPDPKIGWFHPAIKKADEILKTNKVDMIFSTSPEATDHVIARVIAHKTGIPWVIDFRDPWTTSLYAINRPMWAKRKEEALELRCLTEADAISVVQARYRDEYFEKYPSLINHTEKFRILPNGFDRNDFAGISPMKFDKWTVVYTGSISAPRDPEPFFKGWKRACEKSEDFRKNAGCFFMGEFDSRFHELAPKYIMDGLRVMGFKKRDEVYSAQLGAGALLIIAEGYVTGKAYEYLAAGRPIIAITDGIDLIELIGGAGGAGGTGGAGECVGSNDPEKIAQCLLALYMNRDKPFQPNEEYISRFDRRKITGELAKLFDDLIIRDS
ncbi:MAG: glycosyltransferase [bacterium]